MGSRNIEDSQEDPSSLRSFGTRPRRYRATDWLPIDRAETAAERMAGVAYYK